MTDAAHPVSAQDLLRWSEALAGDRPHRPRVHPEPLRAGAVRGGARGGGRHPRRRRAATSSREVARRGVAGRSARASPATSRPRSRWARSSATTRARSCSCSDPIPASGCTRPVGPTSATRASEVAVKEVHEETGIECEVAPAHRRARRPPARASPGCRSTRWCSTAAPSVGSSWPASARVRRRRLVRARRAAVPPRRRRLVGPDRVRRHPRRARRGALRDAAPSHVEGLTPGASPYEPATSAFQPAFETANDATRTG